MSIFFNNSSINDWNFGDDNIIKVYYDNAVCYQKVFKSLEPSFNGKWLATYTAGTTSSAECDSSSAITSGEITLADLETVIIGDCVTSIGFEAFRYCSGLTSINIPSGVTSIEDGAFDSCSGLTSINLNRVEYIGNAAFADCTSLTSIAIPNGVTSIGIEAFFNCSGLTSIDIPNSVTSIGMDSFYGCRSLTSINIPSGVTSIGTGAFQGCTSLTSITINATTPPTLNYGVFGNTNNCPIYVPSASVEAYKTATNWSNYASRIQAIP